MPATLSRTPGRWAELVTNDGDAWSATSAVVAVPADAPDTPLDECEIVADVVDDACRPLIAAAPLMYGLLLESAVSMPANWRARRDELLSGIGPFPNAEAWVAEETEDGDSEVGGYGTFSPTGSVGFYWESRDPFDGTPSGGYTEIARGLYNAADRALVIIAPHMHRLLAESQDGLSASWRRRRDLLLSNIAALAAGDGQLWPKSYGTEDGYETSVAIDPEKPVIHRCGWCGWPCNADGSSAVASNDPDDASDYLRQHAGAQVIKVNGACCPNGDGSYLREDWTP